MQYTRSYRGEGRDYIKISAIYEVIQREGRDHVKTSAIYEVVQTGGERLYKDKYTILPCSAAASWVTMWKNSCMA